jgi:spermidine synthase
MGREKARKAATGNPEVRLEAGAMPAPRPAAPLAGVAALLFGSGACALIYQVAWLREMRLVFGASTPASAAVLAIFMGGLGAGGLWLGRRADRHARPLELYANLELCVAAAAAATPLALVLVRAVYVALGGSVTLGLAGATVVRLLLTALVLGAPTILMGGTLPAAARAVERDDDPRRRRLAVLYGVNTLGAVTGSLLATFILLEVLGTRTMLWTACLVNVLVALVARNLGRTLAPVDVTPPDAAAEARAAAPAPFVLGAAATVGAAFFLMEMVWYRMLGPVLGGSSFTFGLILAMALFGIGLGGAAYATFGSKRPATLAAFGATCTLEAALVALPYALGDRIAILAALLRPLEAFGFYGLAAGWAVVCGLVVLPAAVVAGYQFPLLIALLGRGRVDLGRHVGLAYAWNTAGSIVGSLAGGFGILPLLGAPGTWVAVAVLLLLLGLAAALLGALAGERRWTLVPALGSAAVAGVLLTAMGPTAAWRHTPIGAGRVKFQDRTQSDVEAFLRSHRRAVPWEADGLESSVAIDEGGGVALVVNGKSDGHARGDAGTMVMGGLIGAILHPHPTSALVVGLGTGASAGWLAGVPSIERVDVVELERAVIEVARVVGSINRNVLADPKVHITINDAREVLLTTPRRYDIVFSEPSNPFRAGVASLFTREFYQAAGQRLTAGGVFLQWLQAYEIDAQTVRTVYATLASVFPWIETYQTMSGDLLLVASFSPLRYDVPTLRARLAEPIYAQALALSWRTEGLEGLLGRYVAGPQLARDVAAAVGGYLNTDDRTLIEFDFARSVGRNSSFSIDSLRALARARGAHRPTLTGGPVDWERVEDQRLAMLAAEGVAPQALPGSDAARQARAAALAAFASGDLAGARTAWLQQTKKPDGPAELALVAVAFAEGGHERAPEYIERLRAVQPAEAAVAAALLAWHEQRVPDVARFVEMALYAYHQDPWPLAHVMRHALTLAHGVARTDRAAGERLLAQLDTRFAVSMLEDRRLRDALLLAQVVGFEKHCRRVLDAWEPHFPWAEEALRARVRCYELTRDPRLALARYELDRYLAGLPLAVGAGLQPASSSASTSPSPQT